MYIMHLFSTSKKLNQVASDTHTQADCNPQWMLEVHDEHCGVILVLLFCRQWLMGIRVLQLSSQTRQ